MSDHQKGVSSEMKAMHSIGSNQCNSLDKGRVAANDQIKRQGRWCGTSMLPAMDGHMQSRSASGHTPTIQVWRPSCAHLNAKLWSWVAIKKVIVVIMSSGD